MHKLTTLTLTALLLVPLAALHADLFTIAFAGSVAEAVPPKSMQIEVRQLPEAISAATRSLNSKYIVATPAEGASAEALPLFIYLHGSGGTGSDSWKLRNEPPIKYFSGQKIQPFVIVVPQCMPKTTGERATWEPNDLELLFTHLEKTVPFDKRRVYLVGYSMGGYGTWAWASAFPDHFAAIAPHSGGLGRGGPKDVTPDLDQWAKRLAPLPIWIIHGAIDKVVPAERSERMFKALQSKGASQVELTLLPDKNHDIKDSLWNKDLYAWLLKHSRAGERTSNP